MTTIVRWVQVFVLATLVGGTLAVTGGAAPAQAAVRHCVDDVEYVLDASGMTCSFAKRLIAGANDVAYARYSRSSCRRTNDNGGECTVYRTSFMRGNYRCGFRYFPWDYMSRTICRHVDAPKRRWAWEESA